MHHNFKKTALKAAMEAGDILRRNFGKRHKIGYKGEINLITEIDLRSEQRITKILKREYPDHDILAEEGEGLNRKAEYRWIIDPLDGTTNYAHGFPCFSISIALEKKERVILGVVFDPLRKEIYVALKGKGAYLNRKKINVSKTEKLSEALLATGFAYDVRVSPENNLDHFSNFILGAQGIRRAGSAALDLCYVASGRFDGFWEMKLKPWDMAAGYLIVKEARGEVTDFKGGTFNIFSKEILASNGKIHGEMVKVLNLRKTY
ncbi:MAG: inositol monophosphatase [Nitrospirae bacterium]|nr:inositol monophosphatase [Nitrospirota bacterium]